MKKYDPIILFGTLEQAEALLFSFWDWHPSTGEKFKIERLGWPKDLLVPGRHAMWEVFTYEDSDDHMGGLEIKGIGMIQATEIGTNQTRIMFEDGKTALGDHLPVGRTFQELYEIVRAQLSATDVPSPQKLSVDSAQYGKAGRKTDSFYDQAFEMMEKGTPQADARQWFFEQSKIKPDPGLVKAFNKAMARRRKATK